MSIKKFFSTFFVVFFSLTITLLASTDNDKKKDVTATSYAETITQDDLKSYLSILASDEFEGRKTGTEGAKKAANFIKKHFQALGLKAVGNAGDGYFQSFNLVKRSYPEAYLKFGDTKLNNTEETFFLGSAHMESEIESAVAFAGTGSEAELKLANIKGKTVLFYNRGEGRWNDKTAMAREMGAKAAIVVYGENGEDFNKFKSRLKAYFSGGRLQLPSKEDLEESIVFFISPETAEKMLGKYSKKANALLKVAPTGTKNPFRKIKCGKMKMKVTRSEEKVGTENVLGFLEGTDKKDEIIVITSHYDHIGISGEEVNNGADDDGSGTSAVMEIAQAFTEAANNGQRPRRSILFMTVTGEEMGLFGSQYYVENPIFPLEQTVTNLNIDMIGRVDPDHEENRDYVYVIGSDKLSQELHEVSENANETYSGLELNYKYNDENDPNRFYYRSDHYNFAKNNIPIIFYFNGTHADYHRPTDTVDKIEFDLLEKRARLVFFTAWDLANRENKVSLD